MAIKVNFINVKLIVIVTVSDLDPPVGIVVRHFNLTLRIFSINTNPTSNINCTATVNTVVVPIVFLLGITVLIAHLAGAVGISVCGC